MREVNRGLSEIGGALRKDSVCMFFVVGRSKVAETDHALGFAVPNLQSEATNDFHWVEGRGPWVLQLRNGGRGLQQAVKGDMRVQVMDVVIANIACEPGRDQPGSHET